MPDMNVCVAAVVDRNYQKYIPMFVYFCRVSYPSYGIRIFLTDTLHPAYRDICADLARDGDVKYIENMFRGYPKSNQELKSLRWLIGPAHFQGFDYIYMGDIDILICREDPPLHQQHIAHSNKYNIPYSNSVRPNSKRLSGLHFIVKEKYFQSTLPVIKKYAALLKNRKLTGVKNENLLYNIVRESGLHMPPGWFRPHHGIHLGIWRKKDAHIGEEKWNSIGRNDYVKYHKSFLSVARNPKYKQVYNATPLSEIARMRKHLSAELSREEQQPQMHEPVWTLNYFDLGLHMGTEVAAILNLFNENPQLSLNVFGVEANPRFSAKCKKRYADYANVKIYTFAVGSDDGKVKLYLERKSGQGSSIYADKVNVTRDSVEVRQRSFSNWVRGLELPTEMTINILKANIEGAEYDLIKDLEKNRMFGYFDIYLGSHGSWTCDMRKVKSLQPKIPEAEQILCRNNVKILPFHIALNPNKASQTDIDLLAHVKMCIRRRTDGKQERSISG